MFVRTAAGMAAAFVLLAAAPIAEARDTLDASERAQAIEAVAVTIEENFYDSARGAEIAQSLRSEAAAGGYDDAGTGAALARALAERLSAEDKHFSVRYTPRADRAGQGEAGGPSRARPDGSRHNFGFREVAVLPGNVGYIDMTQFYPAALGGDTAKAALDFIAHTDAVIFDMRDNRGGSPSMVQFLISHFLGLGDDVLINTFVNSARDYPGELRQLDYLPSARRPDVPVYVLTSARSASAGEAFPYHLQALERATIVGERTHGAGNPGRMFEAGHGFSLFVSTSSARNPLTGTNWEGTGVTPDIAVSADEALDQALLLAYEAIAETTENPARRTELAWAGEAIETGAPAIDAARYADLEGNYGPVEIRAAGDALLLQVGRRRPHRLFPVGEDRFVIEDRHDRRLVVMRDRDGAVTAIGYESPGGRVSEIPRS